MAISFFQKLRLALRGWSRRREEEARQRDADFRARNLSWGSPAPAAVATAPAPPQRSKSSIDREGLQVAFLDDSGRIAHFLDIESGDVVEFMETQPRADVLADAQRYRRVPRRSDASEAEDRRIFVTALDDSSLKKRLELSIGSADFRKLLSSDRAIERAWYNFKNDRAIAAINDWLRREGLV